MDISRVPTVIRHAFVPLSGSPLFAGLGETEARAICELHLRTGRKERDSQLIRAQDVAAPLITIVAGTAFRYTMLPNGCRQILSIYVAGDTIGLDTLVSGASAYPVQCASAVTFAAVEHRSAVQLAAEAGWFRDRALAALANERAAAEMAIIRLGQCNAEQRVASFLLEMHHRLQERGLAGAHEFTLELTQQHIADVLGLTAVHLNRVLGRLRAQRLLAMNGQRITLLNASSLRFLAVLPDPYVRARIAS